MAKNQTHAKLKKNVKEITSFMYDNEVYERDVFVCSKAKHKYNTFSTTEKKLLTEAEVVSLIRKKLISNIE